MGTLLFIVIVIAAILAAYYLLPWQMRVVPEEERLVIYRLGRFSRIAGPGVVRMAQIETVHKTIDARDRPRNVNIAGLFFRGIPFDYMLNFWYQVNLQETLGGSQKQLATLAQFADIERDRLVATKVREALVHGLAEMDKNYKAGGKEFFHNLLPLVPGLLKINEDMINAVRRELTSTLRTVGVVLNQQHPITVVNLNIVGDLIASFSRERITTLLREQFPNLPEDTLLEAVGAISGVDMGRKRINVNSNGSESANVSVDDRSDRDMNVRVHPTNKPPSGPSTNQVKPPAQPVAPAAETLSSDDLRVLKRVK